MRLTIHYFLMRCTLVVRDDGSVDVVFLIPLSIDKVKIRKA
jgi:hypothetical protein